MNKIKAVKFRLSGDAACFRKPDVNEKVYFTYNNIHRIALLGLLGAILGLSGYRENRLYGEHKKTFPEFYARLTGIKLAIVPEAERGYFAKKVQYFNNSSGHASREAGGNLQVYEQWLENPAWTIYLIRGDIEQELGDKLLAYLTGQRCVYIPYLGKNDFPAAITNVECCDLVSMERAGLQFINSLFAGDLDAIDDSQTFADRPAYIFAEHAPVALQADHNFYIFDQLFFTNCAVKQVKNGDLLQDGNRILYFF